MCVRCGVVWCDTVSRVGVGGIRVGKLLRRHAPAHHDVRGHVRPPPSRPNPPRAPSSRMRHYGVIFHRGGELWSQHVSALPIPSTGWRCHYGSGTSQY